MRHRTIANDVHETRHTVRRRVDEIDGRRGEGDALLRAADCRKTMRHVSGEVFPGQRPQLAPHRHALIDLAHLELLQTRLQFGLADEDDLEQAASRFELGQRADLLEERLREMLGLVDDQHREGVDRFQRGQELVELIAQIRSRRAGQSPATQIVHRDLTEVHEQHPQQVFTRQVRIGDERGEGLAIELIERRTAQRGLPRPHLAGKDDDALAAADAREQIVEHRAVSRALIQRAWIGGETERLGLEAVKRLVGQGAGRGGRTADRRRRLGIRSEHVVGAVALPVAHVVGIYRRTRSAMTAFRRPIAAFPAGSLQRCAILRPTPYLNGNRYTFNGALTQAQGIACRRRNRNAFFATRAAHWCGHGPRRSICAIGSVSSFATATSRSWRSSSCSASPDSAPTRRRRSIDASVRLLIDLEDERSLAMEGVSTANNSHYLQDPEPYFQTQYRIVTGRDLARRVLARINASRRARSLMGRSASSRRMSRWSRCAPAVSSMSCSSRRTRRWRPTRPTSLAEEYVQQNLDLRRQNMERSLEWLSQELARQKTIVEASERAMAQYREDQNALSLEDRQNIVISRLNQLNDAATRARTNRAQKESLYRRLESLGPKTAPDSIPEILQNPYIQSLKAQLAELERRKALLSERYGDKHPEMLTVNASIQDATRQLNLEIAKAVDSIRHDYESAMLEERTLASALDEQKDLATDLDRKSVTYTVLQRDAAEQPRAVPDAAAAREGAAGAGQQPRQQRAPGRARRDSAGAVQPEPAPGDDAGRDRRLPRGGGPGARARLSRRHRQDARRHRATRTALPGVDSGRAVGSRSAHASHGHNDFARRSARCGRRSP